MTHQTITQASTIWFPDFWSYRQAKSSLVEMGLIDSIGVGDSGKQFTTIFSNNSEDIGMAFYDLELATMCKLVL